MASATVTAHPKGGADEHDRHQGTHAHRCSNDERFATVDRVENGAIKVTKDEQGRHHYIPLSWVTHVDDKVHVDRPGAQAMREWLDAPPKAA